MLVGARRRRDRLLFAAPINPHEAVPVSFVTSRDSTGTAEPCVSSRVGSKGIARSVPDAT